MASPIATETFETVRYSFGEIEGVSSSEGELRVHGTLFAFLDGDDLVVEVPFARAGDLVERGIAEKFALAGDASRNWVRVGDRQLWPELAGEAHEFVGEPAVGGDS